jgi:hypothetical protein
MKKRLGLARTLIACAALGCLPPAMAGGTPKLLIGGVDTTEVLGLDPVACPLQPYLTGTSTGSGSATLLGKVTFNSSDCITPELNMTTFTFTRGKLKLVGADGDELHGEYSGQLLPTPVVPNFVLAGAIRITGGTGKFKNATGAGVMQGTENLQTFQGHINFNLVVSY